MSTQNKSLHSQSAPFDQVAGDYDTSFSKSPVGLLQRERVYKFLSPSISGSILNILEINCGTGEDAIWLAQKGHRVTATDVSEKMIEVVKRKVKNKGLESLIQAQQVSFNEIKDQFTPSSFDLIFSDFGGLNCIPKNELHLLMNDAAGLLKPGGKFIAVIMGRKCVWERGYLLWKGKSKEAFRRNLNQPLKALLGNEIQQTWYYSPGEIQRIASSDFKLNYLKPVGITIPPSYLNPFFDRKRLLLSFFDKLESVLSFSFLSNYADHFYIELQKIK